MIKVCAAARLKICADADEQMARAYLRDVAGIDVGKRMHTQPDFIRFEITGIQFDRALARLTQRFGPIESNRLFRSAGGKWAVDNSYTRWINISDRFKHGPADTGYMIELWDSSHKETRDQFLHRLLGPARAVKRKPRDF